MEENKREQNTQKSTFQELAESLGDLSAMMIKAQGKLVKDDYTNLDGLKSYLDPEIINDL